MRLQIYRYQLRATGPLNAKTLQREFPGALLRNPETGGVGCLHPWPSLGDLSLDRQLSLLSVGSPTQQSLQTLHCIECDGGARSEGRSLFEGLRVPPSHWTASAHCKPSDISAGFDTVKLKANHSLDSLINRVREWEHFKVRVDFNSLGSAGLIRELSQSLGPDWKRIEFIEDPFPASSQWTSLQKELQIRFAADREEAETAAVRICKPALSSAPPGRVVFTSYMDHAIGQLWAAYQAAIHSPGETCGLLTNHLFENDDFFDLLSHDQSRLIPPPGTGLGFDQQLEKLPWKTLS